MNEEDDGIAQLAQAIEELLWVWDAASGRVTYTNPAFDRFFRGAATRSHAGRDTLMEFVAREDAGQLRRLRDGLPLAGYAQEYRVTVPPSETGAPARTARLRERAFAARGARGETRVIHVARDIWWQFETAAQLRAEISRRADAERNLGDATARLEALIATANDPLITIDERSRIIDWNVAAERSFGWSRAEAVGQVLTELIVPPAHRQAHMMGIERFLRDGTAEIFQRRVETRALRRSGEEIDVELSVWPVRTAQGFTFSSFVRDISRRKAQARALAESEAKYRKVVENVNEGILVTAGGRIVYANPRALEQTGLDEEKAQSRPFAEFVHPDDRERLLANHARTAGGQTPADHYQFRMVRKDGAVRWLEISGVPFDWQGHSATLHFVTDVTERREAEQEMRNALARERELSQVKSRFVAVASHEFRTPLAGILSSVELLEDYGARLPDEERREIVQQIRNAVVRMNGMVENMLLTTRLEAGRFAYEPAARELREVMQQVVGELAHDHAQGSRIRMQCAEVEQARYVDAKLLRHILVNLLANALKYSPPETAVECSVAPRDDDRDTIVFTVRDRGIGIPADDLPRLFQTFHRGTNVGNTPGTGMGLSIVKECVELHRGRIEVESEPGRGTTFIVCVPAPLVTAASAE